MASKLQKLAAKAKRNLNDICVMGDTDLARMVGVARDQDGLYFIGRELHGRRVLHPMDAGYQSLNGLYNPDRYTTLENTFELNGCPKVENLQIFDFSEDHDTGDSLDTEKTLEKSRLTISCAYQAVLSMIKDADSGVPAAEDIQALGEILLHWEALTEDRIMALMPWPKRRIPIGKDEKLDALLRKLIVTAANWSKGEKSETSALKAAMDEIQKHVTDEKLSLARGDSLD